MVTSIQVINHCIPAKMVAYATYFNEVLGSDLPVIEESSSENNGVFIAPV